MLPAFVLTASLAGAEASALQQANSQVASLRRILDGVRLVPEELINRLELGESCKEALLQLIECDPYVSRLGEPVYHGAIEDTELAEAVCTETCSNSLKMGISSVNLACGDEEAPQLDSSYVMSLANSTLQGWLETCLRDEATGELCNGEWNLRVRLPDSLENSHESGQT